MNQITGIATHRRFNLVGLDLPTVFGLQWDSRDIGSSEQRRLLHRLVTGGKDDGVIGAGQQRKGASLQGHLAPAKYQNIVRADGVTIEAGNRLTEI